MKQQTNELKNLFEDAKSLSMTRGERASLHLHVEMLFARAGIPMERRDPSRKRYISSPYYLEARAWYHWFMKQSYASTAVFFLVLFLTTGVAGATAGGALPGDFLYSVKVDVNEGLRSLFIFDEAAQAEYEIERVKLRFEEAEALAKRGGLTAETRAYLVASFERHLARVDRRLSALTEGAADRITAEYEATKEAYGRLLADFKAATSTER
ncbi:MAG: hypothetical protein Q8Q36_02915 [bacterium]|nr:hypothetical protein [bacterium]